MKPAHISLIMKVFLASETQIIKDGILVSGLTDMNSAIRLNYKRTPNGRRENFSHKVYARMTKYLFWNR